MVLLPLRTHEGAGSIGLAGGYDYLTLVPLLTFNIFKVLHQ
jgi:hypothetical protein